MVRGIREWIRSGGEAESGSSINMKGEEEGASAPLSPYLIRCFQNPLFLSSELKLKGTVDKFGSPIPLSLLLPSTRVDNATTEERMDFLESPSNVPLTWTLVIGINR